jgi:response regulator RpfG family c-di-GMP phosphodiesterase
MEPYGIYRYNEVKDAALTYLPILALVEVPEKCGNPAQEAFEACDCIRESSPGCRVMLMCPENDRKSVDACEDAKQSGRIEDYVFYDSSPEYLTSKLKAMLPY